MPKVGRDEQRYCGMFAIGIQVFFLYCKYVNINESKKTTNIKD